MQYNGHLLDGRGGVGVIDVRSCKLAAQAVAVISVLTTKWLFYRAIPMRLTKNNNKKNNDITSVIAP